MKINEKFLEKEANMATKGSQVNNIQRLPGPPPGLLSFVSLKNQRNFNTTSGGPGF